MSLPTIPGYEVHDVIGRGGMGRVYRATDRRLGRLVAVKMLLDEADPELISRFESEAKAVASLSHRNIARLFEFSKTESGQPYCVMEYVGGGTLANVISGHPQPWKYAAEVVETLAQGIHSAHQKGILHRDLKPANILVMQASNDLPLADPQRTEVGQGTDEQTLAMTRTVISKVPTVAPDRLRIADFGLARHLASDSRLTQTGQIVGTPAYMSPEQASGVVSQLGPGVDIYSLGVILFEMLTGRPPFLGADTMETIMLLLSEDPPRPRAMLSTIPRDLETICLKCLEKKPSRRYASASDLGDDLTRFLEGRPIVAKSVSHLEQFQKWARRNPWKATALSLFALSGVAAIVGVIALQAAYRDVQQANSDLSHANARLVSANATIRDSSELMKDSLDRVVNRVREGLYDVPQATSLMMATSRDSVELHRRLHVLQPDDLDSTRRFVMALYNHHLLESLHGKREASAATLRELESIFAAELPKYPDDTALLVTRIKVLLDQPSVSGEKDSEAFQLRRTEILSEIDRLLRAEPELPEVQKLASLVAQQTMNLALAADDLPGYITAAKERVRFSQRYFQAESNTAARPEAALWLAQSRRVLAEGYLLVGTPRDAVPVLEEALADLTAAAPEQTSRAVRFENSQLHFVGARGRELQQQPEAALKEYAAAVSLLEKLVHDYPDDVSYRSPLAVALVRSAALDYSLGDAAEALRQLTAAEVQVTEILKLSPGNKEAQTMQAAIPGFRAQIEESAPNGDNAAPPASNREPQLPSAPAK